jgi:signal transduction histidine kinase
MSSNQPFAARRRSVEPFPAPWRVQSTDRRVGRPAHCGTANPSTQSTRVEVFCGEATFDSLVDDVVDRAGAIAAGTEPVRPARAATARLDACEARARGIAVAGGATDETRRTASVEFLGDAVAALALDGAWKAGDARLAVVSSAAAIDMSPGALLLAVFLRAIASSDVAQLPPQIAVELFLWLLVELGPADAASLWTAAPSHRVACIAAAGDAAKSRRLHAAAVAALEARVAGSPHVQAVVVQRWDRPFAALVARIHSTESARLRVWLQEAAAALSPVLERETLFERNAERERELVSASERRSLRLGYDLHDGPLQEIVALAEDLRLARAQVLSLLQEPQTPLITGRFDDLEARLVSLDRGLRDLAHSTRPTTALERPLEDALLNELEAVKRTSGIETSLDVNGDLADLTDSQKIVLYRVVQESIANARKHSGATRVDVHVRALAGYVEATVEDNGCGFDVHATVARALDASRLGLAGVTERVRLLGGAVDIEARVGEGVLVRATLPRWRPTTGSRKAVYSAVTV